MDTNAANVKQEDKGNWNCPCNGCKKARKQALKEVYDIIFQDGDILTNVYLNLMELMKKEGVVVKKERGGA